jgi:hypothetical protein
MLVLDANLNPSLLSNMVDLRLNLGWYSCSFKPCGRLVLVSHRRAKPLRSRCVRTSAATTFPRRPRLRPDSVGMSIVHRAHLQLPRALSSSASSPCASALLQLRLCPQRRHQHQQADAFPLPISVCYRQTCTLCWPAPFCSLLDVSNVLISGCAFLCNLHAAKPDIDLRSCAPWSVRCPGRTCSSPSSCILEYTGVQPSTMPSSPSSHC